MGGIIRLTTRGAQHHDATCGLLSINWALDCRWSSRHFLRKHNSFCNSTHCRYLSRNCRSEGSRRLGLGRRLLRWHADGVLFGLSMKCRIYTKNGFKCSVCFVPFFEFLFFTFVPLGWCPPWKPVG